VTDRESPSFPLSSALVPRLVHVAETGSTNADLLADDSAPHLAVLATLSQTAGRGRLGRTWTAPPGRTLAASVLVERRGLPVEALGWLPLAAGVAMRASVAAVVGAGEVGLKWPNDVQVDGLKVCGILAQLRGDSSAVVVGAGVNLALGRDELPTPVSTSLSLHGAEGPTEALADRVLSGWPTSRPSSPRSRPPAETPTPRGCADACSPSARRSAARCASSCPRGRSSPGRRGRSTLRAGCSSGLRRGRTSPCPRATSPTCAMNDSVSTAEQQPREVVVARLHPHARALFWPSVALVAVSAAGGWFGSWFDLEWQNWIVRGAAVLLGVLLWLVPLLVWLGRRSVITTRRVVLRRGFVVRSRQELLHSRGYDLTVRRNAVQSLFRSGDVLINTGLDRPVVLWDVPGADLVQATLHDLMEANSNLVAQRRQHDQSSPDGWPPLSP
jgi:membrane protein YdbS with pleckstrin-like domain